MTIEEKVKRIVRRAGLFMSDDEATQAILALIKPMSKERLYTIFAKTKGCKESLEDCSYKKCKASRTECELLADAILANGGKE